MKRALVALALSPFIFAGSAGNYYRQHEPPGADVVLSMLIQQKADSAAYVAAGQIDSICRKPIRVLLYSDLDKRPDGRIFQWNTWGETSGADTLYTHTEIKQIK